MSTVVGTLIIDLKANTASFASDMGKMESLSAKTANGVKRSLETIAAAGLAVGAAIAAGSAKLISSALESADSLAKLAESAGTTTETLSELSYAAGLSHLSTEDLGKGLERLSRSAFSAQNGNVALERVFGRLGVSITDSNGRLKDSGELMKEVAPKFAAMGDSAGKTALAMNLFGKGGAALIPFLNEYGIKQAAITKEAQQFGLILGSDVAEKSKQAKENLERLEMMVTGVGRAVLASTLPALIAFGDRLLDLAKQANIPDLAKKFGGEVNTALRILGTSMQFVVTHATALKVAIEGLAALRVANIAIPLLAQLSSGNAIAGVTKLMTSLLGIGKLVPMIASFGSWLKYSVGFLQLMASTEGIAAAASYVLGGAIAAISWPIAIGVGIAAAVAALFAFRNATFSLGGTVYEIRDIWNAAFIAIGKGFTNIGNMFRPVVDTMKKLWSGFANWFSSMSIVSTFKKWFGEALSWASGILGKLTPQWAIDSLNQAKQEREANAGTRSTGSGSASPKVANPAPDTSGLGKPQKDIYGDEIKKLDQAITAQQAYLAVISASPDKIAEVAAAEKARTLIVEMNTRLLDAGRASLTKTQEATLTSKVATEAAAQELVNYGRQLVGETRSAELATKQSGLMTEALFDGEEATRRAAIDSALLGLQYNKTGAELQKFLELQPALREAMQAKADATALEEYGKSIEQQTRAAKIATQEAKNLAAAELLGEAAVRRATIENEIYALSFGKSAAEISAMKDRLQDLRSLLSGKQNADLVQSSNQEVRALQQELAGRQLVIAASLQSTDAMREAELASKLYALNQQIATTTDTEARAALLAKRDAITALTKAEWEEADAKVAASLRSPLDLYKQEIADIERAAAALVKLQGTELTDAEILNVAAKEQDAFNKSIDDTVKQLLRFGGVGDGVKAFFMDMQKQAQSAASIVYDALKSAFDKVSAELTKLLTFQKTSFGKMFADIGRSMLQQTIKSGLQQTVGAIGKSLSIGLGKGSEPGKGSGLDGSTEKNAFWVRIAGGGLAKPGAGGSKLGAPISDAELLGNTKPPGLDGEFSADPTEAVSQAGNAGMFSGFGQILSKLAPGLLGSLFGGGGMFSLMNLIPHYAGGAVSPDHAYLVGENGPEILRGASGSISSNLDSRRMVGGSSVQYNYGGFNIHGADPGLTRQSVYQAITAAHSSSVATSIQGNAERMKRTPQRQS